jgi:ATP-dependent Clp protease ATP-binding subunit ClpA
LFSRFSPASKRVLRAAEQECRNRSHYYVGVEHMLLALLEEHDAAIEARLIELGVRPIEVHAELRRVLGTGEERLWDGILVTPRVRSVVGLAEKAAGTTEVDPLHLLDAIIYEGQGLASEILHRYGNIPQSRRVAG